MFYKKIQMVEKNQQSNWPIILELHFENLQVKKVGFEEVIEILQE